MRGRRESAERVATPGILKRLFGDPGPEGEAGAARSGREDLDRNHTEQLRFGHPDWHHEGRETVEVLLGGQL